MSLHHRLDRHRIVTVVVGIVLVAAILVVTRFVQMQNNGDGWRVLRSAQIDAPNDYFAWKSFPRYFDFTPLDALTPRYLVPASPTAAIVEAISFSQRALGFSRFDFMAVTALYAVLYVAGLMLLIGRVRRAFWIPAAVLLFNPYILAYFNSPYEESLFIALSPLLAHFISNGMRPRSAASATALVISIVKVQFAPAALLGLGRDSARRTIIYLVIVLAVLVASILKSNALRASNDYNRFFNGLAYSASDVSTWRANEFLERRAAADTLVDGSGIDLPADIGAQRQLWGSSYWPTGIEQDTARQQFVAEHVRGWYWQTLGANPSLMVDAVVQPVATAIAADYRLRYIFRSELAEGWLAVGTVTMRYFGWIVLIASIASIAVAARRRNARAMLFAVVALLYPILAVYGDGYYELEKHLLPVFNLAVVVSLGIAATPRERSTSDER
ncbi:MAG TPA: hypothetical protein VNA88_17810 [Candidatus Kapabacteria bacterium]|nr:hypothetical protein [Candidatus Kapabacteria bacterium]